MINLLLMLLYAAAGFVVGTAIIGAVPAFRSHPRYLMTAGAAVMPLIWATHALTGTKPGLWGLDLALLMTAVGMVVSGWEAEAETEAQVEGERQERLKKLRAAWEAQQDVSPRGTSWDDIGTDTRPVRASAPAGVDSPPAASAPAHLEVESPPEEQTDVPEPVDIDSRRELHTPDTPADP
ncbi:MAG: hypothetical protein ACLQVD_00065 [Capsulimonadaceae bacterium]